MAANEADPLSPAELLLDLPLVDIGEHLEGADHQTLELVRFAAANNALSAHDVSKDARLQWAGVALRSIQLMRSTKQDDPDLDQKEMRVRAGLIGAVGADRSQPLLDPEPVADWFFSSLGEETMVNAQVDAGAPLSALSIERLRELRRIKNDLGVVALLARSVSTLAPPRDTLVADWLSIRASLP